MMEMMGGMGWASGLVVTMIQVILILFGIALVKYIFFE